MRPDIVVLDLQLKGGSGTNVIRAVRSAPELAATRVLVASNYVSEALREGCLALGADAYYDKVKDLAKLAAMIAELADERGLIAS
jgi:CheY-like chemotaxis protein